MLLFGKEPLLGQEQQALQGSCWLTPACWHSHMVVTDSEKRPPGAGVAEPRVSIGSSSSLPAPAGPALPAGPGYLVFPNLPLPCLVCPSCLLVLKQTPAHSSNPSPSVPLPHAALSDFPQADWTALLCLPPQCHI
jgi:hypothetical protein